MVVKLKNGLHVGLIVSFPGPFIAVSLITLTFHAFVVENSIDTSDQYNPFPLQTNPLNSSRPKPRVIVMIPARKGLHKRIEEKAASALRALESGNPDLSLRIFIFDKVNPRYFPPQSPPRPPRDYP